MTDRIPEHPQVRLFCRADAVGPARRRQRTVRERLSTLLESGTGPTVEAEAGSRGTAD